MLAGIFMCLLYNLQSEVWTRFRRFSRHRWKIGLHLFSSSLKTLLFFLGQFRPWVFETDQNLRVLPVLIKFKKPKETNQFSTAISCFNAGLKRRLKRRGMKRVTTGKGQGAQPTQCRTNPGWKLRNSLRRRQSSKQKKKEAPSDRLLRFGHLICNPLFC